MSTPPDLAESDEDEEIDEGEEDQPTASDATYARLEQAQVQRQLVEVVRRLPPSERRIVLGHYFQLQPFEEIALELGLTKGRVSQLHHSALRRIREWGSAKDLPQPG